MPYASPIADHRPGLARRPHSHSGNITFSNERSGPGAHAPLPVLPRRASKGAIFQLTEEQEHSSPDDSPALPLFAADEDDDYPPPLQLKKGNIASSFKHPGLGLRVDTDSRNGSPVGGGSPMGAVPFPRLSPQPAASSPVLLQTSASMGHIRQGSDAPLVRKSNGQLLKSSLKSSQSSPHLPLPPQQNPYYYSKSAPSTPSISKAVHFPEQDSGLESVVLFEAKARPTAVSLSSADRAWISEGETETEGEGDGNPLRLRFAGAGGSSSGAFPFPSLPPKSAAAAPGAPTLFIAPTSSQIPSAHTVSLLLASSPNSYSITSSLTPAPTRPHVLLESLALPPTRPPFLQGTILVRNIAFAKQVYVRFTLDGWSTTSEVAARWSLGLKRLPLAFSGPPSFHSASVHTRSRSDATHNRLPPTSPFSSFELVEENWDRFTFTIKLADVERSLTRRKMEFVVRYYLPGDRTEWWDNNGGENFQVSFVEGNPTGGVTGATTAKPPLIWGMSTPTGPASPAAGPAPSNGNGTKSSAPPQARPRTPSFPTIPLKLSNYSRPSPPSVSASSSVPFSSSSASSTAETMISPPESPILERGRGNQRSGAGGGGAGGGEWETIIVGGMPATIMKGSGGLHGHERAATWDGFVGSKSFSSSLSSSSAAVPASSSSPTTTNTNTITTTPQVIIPTPPDSTTPTPEHATSPLPSPTRQQVPDIDSEKDTATPNAQLTPTAAGGKGGYLANAPIMPAPLTTSTTLALPKKDSKEASPSPSPSSSLPPMEFIQKYCFFGTPSQGPNSVSSTPLSSPPAVPSSASGPATSTTAVPRIPSALSLALLNPQHHQRTTSQSQSQSPSSTPPLSTTSSLASSLLSPLTQTPTSSTILQPLYIPTQTQMQMQRRPLSVPTLSSSMGMSAMYGSPPSSFAFAGMGDERLLYTPNFGESRMGVNSPLGGEPPGGGLARIGNGGANGGGTGGGVKGEDKKEGKGFGWMGGYGVALGG